VQHSTTRLSAICMDCSSSRMIRAQIAIASLQSARWKANCGFVLPM